MIGELTGGSLTMVFGWQSVSSSLAWDQISVALESKDVLEPSYEIYGRSLPTSTIGSRIAKSHGDHFHLSGGLYEFRYASVGTKRFDFIEIKTPGTGEDWDPWVRHVSISGDFVQAFASNSEYDYWQNAQDPLQYTALGRTCEGLPMISNGLPFPLEGQIIDTSRNPGRRVLREGFIEVAAAQMWLAEPFWKLTGTDKGTVLADPVLGANEEDGWVRISVGAPFVSSEREVGEMQDHIRSVLYPAASRSPRP